MGPPIRVQTLNLQAVFRQLLGRSLTEPFDLTVLQDIRPVFDVGPVGGLPEFVEQYSTAAVAGETSGIRMICPADVFVYPLFVGIRNTAVGGFRIDVISPPPAAISALTNSSLAAGRRIDDLARRSISRWETGAQTAANWGGAEIRFGGSAPEAGSMGPATGNVIDFRGWRLKPQEHLIIRSSPANLATDMWCQWSEGPTEA